MGKSYKQIVFAIFMLLCLNIGLNAQEEQKLRVGDQAPQITNVKWLIGEPVTSFAQDKTYVIEFGYIGCPACNIAIPHLSKVAKDYAEKGVEVISIFYREKLANMPAFLKSKSKDIAYKVAIDLESKKSMESLWLKAAGINYAPSSFIVDKSGKIAWVGSPRKGYGLEEALDEVLEGKYPYNSVINRKLRSAYNNAAGRMKKSGDYVSAIAILDSAIAKYPDYDPYRTIKFNYLLDFDEERAYVYGKELLSNHFYDDPTVLHNFLSNSIISKGESQKLSTAYWDLVIDLNERAMEVNEYDFYEISMKFHIVKANKEMGKLKKAIQGLENIITDLGDMEIDVTQKSKSLSYFSRYLNKLKGI